MPIKTYRSQEKVKEARQMPIRTKPKWFLAVSLAAKGLRVLLLDRDNSKASKIRPSPRRPLPRFSTSCTATMDPQY